MVRARACAGSRGHTDAQHVPPARLLLLRRRRLRFEGPPGTERTASALEARFTEAVLAECTAIRRVAVVMSTVGV